ncbi:MAG: FIST N-terminal domain-containing protein [Anaerolineales bacterium]|nr:FIST N-terminal domain-containing protein [Anaerolineales bacterium]
MTLLAAIGKAQALDGREAGLQAAHQALNQLGSASCILGLVISSHQYEAQQVVNGVCSLLGPTPLVGFSSPAGLTADGMHPHSVVVALLCSNAAKADVHWLAGYTQGENAAEQGLAGLLSQNPNQTALLFADGFNGDAEQLCASLPPAARLVGALSSGDLHAGNAFQISGKQAGSSGLALARLESGIKIGIGYGHGWQPVGSRFRVTRSRGFWLRTLDGRPAVESYAQLFGYPASDWVVPPLNHLIRLYPLGLEGPGEALLIRSPLRVEADGSFRMNATLRNDSQACLLVGSLAACRQAAQTATREAMAALDGAKPALALVLVDLAWGMLFEAQPGGEVAAVQEVLGAEVPIAGGYTLGQIVPGEEGTPQFLNQHMLVVVFGEEGE